MTMGERIRERRIALELSQDELAKRMGYKSRAAICKVETGEDNLAADRITKFAKALSTTEAYLMGWETETSLANALASTSPDEMAEIMFSAETKTLIHMFRALSAEKKQALLDMAEFLYKKEKDINS